MPPLKGENVFEQKRGRKKGTLFIQIKERKVAWKILTMYAPQGS